MDTETFNAFREIVYARGGISINENKLALVEARIGKRLRELDMSDPREYLGMIKNDVNGEELVNLLDVISTNVTSFFREHEHFNFLGEVFTQWTSQGQSQFRFWSAASSSGEEPYTIAMTLLDKLGNHSPDIRILATDISTRILKVAQAGIYPEEKIAGVPESFQQRFFSSATINGKPMVSVNESVKRLVTFSRINLSKTPFPMNGPMDAVFCRNVMIYFDNLVRKRLLDDIYRMLKPGGYLFVGHAESLAGIQSAFKAVVPSVYIKQ